MSQAHTAEQFSVSSLGDLRIGQAKTIHPTGSNGPTMEEGKPWTLPASIYKPRQIVEANAPLLETVLHHLGQSPPGEPSAREQLIDNLSSNLALGTRESSINIPTGGGGRTELAQQAIRIGKTLVIYARNVTDAQYDPNYVVRSPCEGHLLKPHVSYLMFRPRSLRHLMQIYNEYLHQVVLLRDALLPFENYEDVLIPITPGPKRGLRHIEDARSLFLTEVLTKQVTQRTILKLAQSLLAPSLYIESQVGFQYIAGVVLPASVAGGRSSRLLQYCPAVLDPSVDKLALRYELQDYDAVRRESVFCAADRSAMTDSTFRSAGLTIHDDNAGGRYIRLNIDWGDQTTIVDLGQVARGARYAHYFEGGMEDMHSEEKLSISCHDAHSVLSLTNNSLLLPSEGTHVIRASSTLEALALLGRLYPDNILVMSEGKSIAKALKACKGGFTDAGRFIVHIENHHQLNA